MWHNEQIFVFVINMVFVLITNGCLLAFSKPSGLYRVLDQINHGVAERKAGGGGGRVWRNTLASDSLDLRVGSKCLFPDKKKLMFPCITPERLLDFYNVNVLWYFLLLLTPSYVSSDKTTPRYLLNYYLKQMMKFN